MLFLLLEAEERVILKYNSCLQCCPWEMQAVSKNVNWEYLWTVPILHTNAHFPFWVVFYLPSVYLPFGTHSMSLNGVKYLFVIMLLLTSICTGVDNITYSILYETSKINDGWVYSKDYKQELRNAWNVLVLLHNKEQYWLFRIWNRFSLQTYNIYYCSSVQKYVTKLM